MYSRCVSAALLRARSCQCAAVCSPAALSKPVSLPQVPNRLEPGDKVKAEALRFFNGMAFKRGADHDARHGFDSSSVVSSLQPEGGARASAWPTAAAPAAAGAPALVEQWGVGGTAQTVFVSAPAMPAVPVFAAAPRARDIPGRRSDIDAGLRRGVGRVSSAPQHEDDVMRLPTGELINAHPSPTKGRRKPRGGASFGAAFSVAGAPPPPTGVALVDHLAFSDAGLTTVESATVGYAWAANKAYPERKIAAVSARARSDGAAVGLRSDLAPGPPGTDGQLSIPVSGLVAGLGRRHYNDALAGREASSIFSNSNAAEAQNAVAASSAARLREARDAPHDDRFVTATQREYRGDVAGGPKAHTPRRRAYGAPPPGIAFLDRPTNIY